MAPSLSPGGASRRAGAAPRRPLPLLRNELLVTLALLATMALLMAVASVVLVFQRVESPEGGTYLAALIALDAVVFVIFGAFQVRRLVLRPLAEVISATEAIAGGDLSRRVAPGETREFDALADSVNRMTDHLLEAQAQRVRVEKMASVGRLAAGIAHEIGNPLGAINGYLHILRIKEGDADAARDALEGLERETLRIDRIVRGLLDYARPRRVTPLPIDPNDIVRGAVGLLRDQGVLRRVDLDMSLGANIPRLVGERHELEQVLVNLLLNAVDAMDGTGTIAIRTRRATPAELREGAPRRAGDRDDVAVPRAPAARVAQWLDRVGDVAELVQIVVADSGAGVPDSEAERIFDPFYTTKAPGKGTGLGLAIAARVVENLRGTIWVQHAREGGAAFVLLFAAPALPSPIAERAR